MWVKKTNALAGEVSPYLLQHAHNPVDWMPWGDEVRDGAGGAMLIMIFDVFTLGFFLFGVAGSGMGCLPGHRPSGNGKTDSDDSG